MKPIELLSKLEAFAGLDPQAILSHPAWGIVNIFGFSWPETSRVYWVASLVHHAATWAFLAAFCRLVWLLGDTPRATPCFCRGHFPVKRPESGE